MTDWALKNEQEPLGHQEPAHEVRQTIPEPADGKERLGRWKRRVAIPATRNTSQRSIGKKLTLEGRTRRQGHGGA